MYVIYIAMKWLARLGVMAPLLLAPLLLAQGVEAAERLVVVTSYPEEMTTVFERAFERAYPEIHIQIDWKQGRDALASLKQPGRGGADVYWSPSLETHRALAASGAYLPLGSDRQALPGRIGRAQISDLEGRFEAFEVAGYGTPPRSGASSPSASASRSLSEDSPSAPA